MNLPKPINTNTEYQIEDVSLLCEVGCNITVKTGAGEDHEQVTAFVRGLPADEVFMSELGEFFIKLVKKHVTIRNED